MRTYLFHRTPATLGDPPAPWRSGYAAACKAVYTGSIPVGASAVWRDPDGDTRGRRRPSVPGRVARIAAISRKTVYREIGRGELPAVQVGRQLRIDPTDLEPLPGAHAVTNLLQRHAPGRASGSAAAAAKTCPDSVDADDQ